MKKFFTLIAAALMAVGASAQTALSGAFSSWGDGCTVDGNSISFTAAWKGAGYWLATGDASAGTYAGYDMSSFDYIWVTVADGSTAGIKMCIQYGSSCAAGASGTSETTADAGALIIGAKLDPDQKADVSQFFLQATTVGALTVTGAYVGTEAEFEAAKAGNKQQKTDLTLADLGSGWESSYDATTKTITYEGDWKGRGWWLGTADYSGYDQVVIKFAEPLSGYCQVNIEYVDNQKVDGVDNMNSSTGAEAGATEIVAPLNDTGKNAVKQIYIQNGEGVTSISLADAFVCTKEYYNTGISEVSVAPSAAKAAVKVAKDGKIVIVKGNAEFNVAGQLVK